MQNKNQKIKFSSGLFFSKNKKGLSDVITTLIIILLVIVAVGILWVVLRNLITKGTDTLSTSDFTTDLQIQKVTINATSVNVKVKLNQGDAIDGVLVSISDGQNSQVFKQLVPINTQEERTFVIEYTGVVKKISVSPIIVSEKGQEQVGQVSNSYDYQNTSSTIVQPIVQCTVNANCTSLNTNVTSCSGLNVTWTANNYSCSGGNCVANQTTGMLRSCNDNNVGTTDSCSLGICSNIAITSCTNSDGYCPSGCTNSNDNDCSSFVPTIFVTSANYTGGTLGADLNLSDFKCQTLANAVGFSGTWKAWISNCTPVNGCSTPYSPHTRMVHSNSPYVLPNGSIVANNWNDLTDGTILSQIIIDENGNNVGRMPVATGTNYNGSNFNTSSDDSGRYCGNWVGTTWFYGGYTDMIDYRWTARMNYSYGVGGYAGIACNIPTKLYCLKQ